MEKTSSEPIQMSKIATLFIINLICILIVGFLTLDSEANLNSRVGAYVLSILMPYLIVMKTPHLAPETRVIKYGLGALFYIVLVLFALKILYAFQCGLIPCLITFLALLYKGDSLWQKH